MTRFTKMVVIVGVSLAFDGRNQYSRVIYINQNKTLRTYILPETKRDILSLPRFDEFHLNSFRLLRQQVGLLSLVQCRIHLSSFEGSPPRITFRCSYTN